MHAMQRQLPANRLRELREARGWKPYNVAHLLGEMTGETVDPSTVYRWERGGTINDADKFALAELYGVTPTYLMGWDDEPVAA